MSITVKSINRGGSVFDETYQEKCKAKLFMTEKEVEEPPFASLLSDSSLMLTTLN